MSEDEDEFCDTCAGAKPMFEREDAIRALEYGRMLIGTFDKWAKGNCAEEQSGFRVAFFSDAARKFCAHGAMLRAAYDLRGKGYWGALAYLMDEVYARGFNGVLLFEESQPPTPEGHMAVLALFDVAIARAKEANHV